MRKVAVAVLLAVVFVVGIGIGIIMTPNVASACQPGYACEYFYQCYNTVLSRCDGETVITIGGPCGYAGGACVSGCCVCDVCP